MKPRTLLFVLLTVACLVAGQFWTAWVQPELVTRIALAQMERSDHAARWMRFVGQAQQWPLGLMAFTFLAGVLLILWTHRKQPGA